ncbi:hypothetical protein AL486_07080 [Pandoraea apista]|nr:hypothetical protein AL486_07080 [Pandoraea apista]
MRKRALQITISCVGIPLVTGGCVGLDKDWVSAPQCNAPHPVYAKTRIYRSPMMPDPLVSYVVDEHAVVRDVVLKRSSGSDVLDVEALRAVKEMICTRPAMDDRGYAWPYAVTTEIKFGFRR